MPRQTSAAPTFAAKMGSAKPGKLAGRHVALNEPTAVIRTARTLARQARANDDTAAERFWRAVARRANRANGYGR